MLEIMSMQRPQLSTNLILSCTNETEMIGMPCLHSKITAATTTFFCGVFSASQIFSGGFSVNAENIQLGGQIRRLGV